MKTYLQSLADIFRALESVVYDRAEPFDAVLKYAGNFFTGFVPNAVKAPIRAAKSTTPERRVFGPRRDKTSKFMERIIQGTEVGTFFDPDLAKIDLWGRERMRDGAPIAAPQTDFLWRLLVPVQSSRYNETVGDRMIYNWSRLHPDERYRPRGASPFVTINGRKIWFTNEGFQEFQKRRGKMASKLLKQYADSAQIDGTNPSSQDMDVLRAAFRDGTDYAKTTMVHDGLIEIPGL